MWLMIVSSFHFLDVSLVCRVSVRLAIVSLLLVTRPRMGPSLGFVTYVLYFLCGALLHIMVCSIASLDLYCAIGD